VGRSGPDSRPALIEPEFEDDVAEEAEAPAIAPQAAKRVRVDAALADAPYRTASVPGPRVAPDLASLPLPRVTTSAASKLAVRLSPVFGARPNIFRAAAALLLFVTAGALVAWLLTASHGRDDSLLLMLVMGACAGAGAAGVWIGRGSLGAAALRRAPLPVVELSWEPGHRGSTLDVHVEQAGPLHLFALRVAVACDERCEVHLGAENIGRLEALPRSSSALGAFFMRSSNLRTHRVFERVLVETHDVDIPREAPWTHLFHVEIPADAPISFLATRHGIDWRIEVTLSFGRDDETTSVFPFRVLPWSTE
jgi:hypothetical protein